jgi:hypothetical protein
MEWSHSRLVHRVANKGLDGLRRQRYRRLSPLAASAFSSRGRPLFAGDQFPDIPRIPAKRASVQMLRYRMIGCKRARSAEVTSMIIPLRMPCSRTASVTEKPKFGLFRKVPSTRFRLLIVERLDSPVQSDIAVRLRLGNSGALHEPRFKIAGVVLPQDIREAVAVVIAGLHDRPVEPHIAQVRGRADIERLGRRPQQPDPDVAQVVTPENVGISVASKSPMPAIDQLAGIEPKSTAMAIVGPGPQSEPAPPVVVGGKAAAHCALPTCNTQTRTSPVRVLRRKIQPFKSAPTTVQLAGNTPTGEMEAI